jgi:uncharacterized protein YhhL (DUF1145 family)
MTIRQKLNGYITIKDVCYWLTIIIALVGPYFLHERRIAEIATDIAVIKVQIAEINKQLEKSKAFGWIERAQ